MMGLPPVKRTHCGTIVRYPSCKKQKIRSPKKQQTFLRLSEVSSEDLNEEPSIKYERKILRKTNISNPLIRTRTFAYQGVRNVSFSENFAYVLNE